MLQALAILYTLASLAHVVHNAESIAHYPGLPGWMTRESVDLAWLAVGGLGLRSSAAVLALVRHRRHPRPDA